MTDSDLDALVERLGEPWRCGPAEMREAAQTIRTLCEERDKTRCPIQLDDTPDICSASSCYRCLGERLKWMTGQHETALADVAALLSIMQKCVARMEKDPPSTEFVLAALKRAIKEIHPGSTLIADNAALRALLTKFIEGRNIHTFRSSIEIEAERLLPTPSLGSVLLEREKQRIHVIDGSLEAIIIRCEEGDPKTDWLPTIAAIAKRARAALKAMD